MAPVPNPYVGAVASTAKSAMKSTRDFRSPFSVVQTFLTPVLIRELTSRSVAVAAAERYRVCRVSYAGDEGGIVYHVDCGEGREALVISLTHLIIPATVPVAAEVAAYQKRRIKKLRKLHGA